MCTAQKNTSKTPPPFQWCRAYHVLLAICLRHIPLSTLHYVTGLRSVRTSLHYVPYTPFRFKRCISLSNPHKGSPFTTFHNLTPCYISPLQKQIIVFIHRYLLSLQFHFAWLLFHSVRCYPCLSLPNSAVCPADMLTPINT
jgi:hypothetical protein